MATIYYCTIVTPVDFLTLLMSHSKT
uniref:Uncharacterized protein n=1 Tax=Anguilla anguilla TaxID=7936 RepID=A0A0E9V2J3_ANGAN